MLRVQCYNAFNQEEDKPMVRTVTLMSHIVFYKYDSDTMHSIEKRTNLLTGQWPNVVYIK